MSEQKAPVLGDKPWWKSWTVLGSIIFSAAVGAAESGLLPPEWAHAIQAVGGLLAVFGIRRAVA